MFAIVFAAAAFASEVHLLGDIHPLAEGLHVWTAGTLANLRAEPSIDAPVLQRLATGTQVVVVEDAGPWVRVRAGTVRGWMARELVSTMGRVTDLDGDGVEERVVVALGADGRTSAWLREGDVVRRVTLSEWPSAWLANWELLPAEEAGVALLRVHLDREGCGSYPTSWLSWSDGQFREALWVTPWVDGAMSTSVDVSFPAPGAASIVVRERDEEGDVTEVHEQACVLSAGVFQCS